MSLRKCQQDVEERGYRLETALHHGCWVARVVRSDDPDEAVVEIGAATEVEAAYTAVVELEALLASTRFDRGTCVPP
jgi:hypothetical protein